MRAASQTTPRSATRNGPLWKRGQKKTLLSEGIIPSPHSARRSPLKRGAQKSPPSATRGVARSAGGCASAAQHPSGFTLVELVVVIAISGIIAAVLSVLLSGPINAYHDQAERTALVTAADAALRRMASDIRNALPNSIRIAGGGTALQMINVLDGARYRDDVPGNQSRRLRFNGSDDEFNLLGGFTRLGDFSRDNVQLVIFNLGQPGADAYAGDAVITPAGLTVTVADDSGGGAIANEKHVTLSSSHQFAFQSSGQRIYVVDNAISYICSGGQLTRRVDAIGNPQPTTGGVLAAESVSSCAFTYNAGTASRGGLVTLDITLTRNGESARLIHQVHVVNVP